MSGVVGALKKTKRRTTEKLLQRLGQSEQTPDDKDFNTLQAEFLDTQKQMVVLLSKFQLYAESLEKWQRCGESLAKELGTFVQSGRDFKCESKGALEELHAGFAEAQQDLGGICSNLVDKWSLQILSPMRDVTLTLNENVKERLAQRASDKVDYDVYRRRAKSLTATEATAPSGLGPGGATIGSDAGERQRAASAGSGSSGGSGGSGSGSGGRGIGKSAPPASKLKLNHAQRNFSKLAATQTRYEENNAFLLEQFRRMYESRSELIVDEVALAVHFQKEFMKSVINVMSGKFNNQLHKHLPKDTNNSFDKRKNRWVVGGSDETIAVVGYNAEATAAAAAAASSAAVVAAAAAASASGDGDAVADTSASATATATATANAKRGNTARHYARNAPRGKQKVFLKHMAKKPFALSGRDVTAADDKRAKSKADAAYVLPRMSEDTLAAVSAATAAMAPANPHERSFQGASMVSYKVQLPIEPPVTPVHQRPSVFQPQQFSCQEVEEVEEGEEGEEEGEGSKSKPGAEGNDDDDDDNDDDDDEGGRSDSETTINSESVEEDYADDFEEEEEQAAAALDKQIKQTEEEEDDDDDDDDDDQSDEDAAEERRISSLLGSDTNNKDIVQVMHIDSVLNTSSVRAYGIDMPAVGPNGSSAAA